MIVSSKNIMKQSMQGVIKHFKNFSTGEVAPSGAVFVSTEAPKGEFGVQIISNSKNTPERVKFRAPGYFHLQGIKMLANQHMLADLVTIIGTSDIVFGEVDR